MTLKDLLARAKSLGIKGRHDLSKADLETAVAQREQISQVSDQAKRAAAEIKGGPERRRGANLNTPWAKKFYYLDDTAYQAAKVDGRVAKAPMQVQLLLKFMSERGITSRAQAQQGMPIASVAVSSGYVKTVIEPHVLFAYYKRVMETLGLVFAGYNVDGDEDADPEAEAEAQDQAALESGTDETEGE